MSQRFHRLIPLAFAITALIGFADATYLAVKHFQNEIPPCTLVAGCDVVTTSTYATIFGIPVALIGSLYYLALLTLAIAFFDTKKEALFRFACTSTWIGLIASMYFVYLQLFVLDAICLYCMGSAVTSTVLFVLGTLFLKRNYRKLEKIT